MRRLAANIRLVTIDLDDTLWPCAPVISHAEETLYSWLAERAPRLAAAHDVASLREHRKAIAAEQPRRAHDLTWLRQEHLRRLLDDYGYDPALAAEGVERFRVARNRVTPYPDVLEVLAGWRRRFVLVSVTNGNADVEQTPLRGLFHHHFDAAGTGAAKPDPAMLRAALDRVAVSPQQAVHVGDDPVRDVVPARELGFRTVWVNRGARAWPGALPPPDAEVASLAEIVL